VIPCVAALLSVAPLVLAAGQVPPPAPAPVVVAPAVERAARLARWAAALELDLAHEVLAEGRAPCAPGGAAERDGELLALYARAVFAAGREDEALALTRRAAADEAGARALALAAARFALERDELARALELLTTRSAAGASARYPGCPEAEWLRGLALARLERAHEARAHLEAFVALAPRAPEGPGALHLLARLAAARGEAAAAEELARRAQAASEWQAYYRARRLQAREHPDDPLPLLGLAELWIAAEDWVALRAVLTDLTTRFARHARGWALLGDLERREQRFDAAQLAYERALAADALSAEARVGRARLALARGDERGARGEYDTFAALSNAREVRFATAHLERARLCLKAGERALAEASHALYRELGGREPLEPR